jgi:hypothetical protein
MYKHPMDSIGLYKRVCKQGGLDTEGSYVVYGMSLSIMYHHSMIQYNI